MNVLIGIVIFLIILGFIEGLYFLFTRVGDQEKKRIQRRLAALSSGVYETTDIEGVDILRKRLLSQVPWFNRLLLSIPSAHQMDRILEQADIQYPLGVFILLSIVLAVAGFLIGLFFARSYLIAILPMAILGALPFLYIHFRKKRRMLKFEQQLPDAMEFIARALRAGHAFSSGLKMVADEFDDPLGTEFERTMNEINFGVSVTDALKNLPNRVDCPDLKYFVISVILQRETGGNLSEILDNIAHIIRERFKLYGQIRSLTAEGRLSAIILIAIPIFVGLLIYFVSPEYIGLLATDPIGRMMAIGALIMMVLGVLVMRKIIEIKV